ncbi:hypothetical protein GCM10025883_15240 [Mobilicoccus caccae]|uniref:UvrC family homology region profile domain-containing protein n=1 Tax=Mobilicoccus caccae TaxID=1859295 RepID=A0ABQ6IRX4_9MICO|nr:hypothetical protein GCM10025883_15240 [Mobilicoccus caccae]
MPREVLVSVAPREVDVFAQWLTTRRGSAVDVRIPRRGDKRALMETVTRNATQALGRHKVARAGDLTARSKALEELQEFLDLDEAPLRIECYDVSHVQGTNVVASMVVFEDGLPRKSEYRRFIARGEGTGTDGRLRGADGAALHDAAAMAEVLRRRFRRLRTTESERAEQAESTQPSERSAQAGRSGQIEPGEDQGTPAGIDPETGRPKRFAYAPQLVVVDGGLPQVEAAADVLTDLGFTDVAVVGLAKRLEEVWVPGEAFPVVLPRTSEGLFLLQRLRDEAHRFAITFHRQRRSKAMTASELDAVPGLGPSRRAALLARFGSVKKIRQASMEEIREVQGIGPALAETIVTRLGANAPAPAVDMLTGEVLEAAPTRHDGAGAQPDAPPPAQERP